MKLAFVLLFTLLLLIAAPMAWLSGEWLAVGAALLIVFGIAAIALGVSSWAIDEALKAAAPLLRR